MADAAAGKPQAGIDILEFKIGMLPDDLLRRHARSKKLQDIGYANPHAANARVPTALPRVDGDPIHQLSHARSLAQVGGPAERYAAEPRRGNETFIRVTQLPPAVGSSGWFGGSRTCDTVSACACAGAVWQIGTPRYSTDVIVACRMLRRQLPSDSFRQTSVKRRRTILPAFGFGEVSRGFTTSSPMITT